MRTAWPLFSLGCVAAALIAAGCSTHPLGPDYHQPPDAIASQPAASRPFAGVRQSAQAPEEGNDSPFVSAPLPTHWWRLYQDPRLDALVQKALLRNTDLRQAVANLERERAIEAEVAGGRQPTIGVSGGPSFGHVSGLTVLSPGYEPPSRMNYSAGVQLSYQLDLFGQLRRAIEAAADSGEGAEAAVDLARVNVAAGVARAYADVCSSGLRLRSARTSVQLQQEAVDVSQRLQNAGRAGAIDLGRAKGQLAQLQAAMPPLEAGRQGALYRLATLTGDTPQDFPRDVQDCATPPRMTGLIPVGDGAALLRRRPDIRQAERALAASTARIGVAMADLYPKISLGASVASAGTLHDFGGKDTIGWSLGPLISWSLPNTGVAQARIDQAEAATRGALAKFDGVVLTALRETETALNAYARELDRRAALQNARAEAATVAQQARRLYSNGKTAYLDALDADRALATIDATLAASDAQLVDDQVTLFLALGGGWEVDPAPSSVTTRTAP